MAEKRSVTQLNKESPASQRAGLGTKLDQLTEFAKLFYSGSALLHTPALTNTTTALAFSAFNYLINGIMARKAAGTQALTATSDDVAQDKWASFRVSIAAGGTVTITRAADQDTEALAHSTLAAVPANQADMGYFVVRGGTAAIYDATTTNLQTGGVTGMVVLFFSAAPAVVQPTSLT